MKQKILFVDELVEDPSQGDPEYGKIKASLEGSNMQRYLDNLKLIAQLSSAYEITAFSDLFDTTQDMFRQADCLITNLPRLCRNNFPQLEYYRQTLQFLKFLRQGSSTAIIAYSGAPRTVLEHAIENKIADYAIPRKRHDLETEIEMIDLFMKSLKDPAVKPYQIY